MTSKKSFLSVVLAAVMVFAMMPIAAGTAYAADEYTSGGIVYSLNNDGTATVTDCTEDLPETVTIPAAVTSGEKEYTVTKIGSGVFSDSGMTSLSFEAGENITSIYETAFSGCDTLSEVVIPSGLTSIPRGLFANLESLSKVTIPETITSIGESAFESCEGLKTIDIPKSVTSIGNKAFLFSGVTDVNFEEGTGLKSIGSSAFAFCSDLTEFTIPDSVTSIGDSAFQGSQKLEAITIPANVESIGKKAFNWIANLKSVSFAEGNKLSTIGSGAFSQCRSLTKIVIPGSVTSLAEDAFSECEKLTEISFYSADGIKYEIKDGNAKITGYNDRLPENVVFPAGITFGGNTYAVTEITSPAFSGAGMTSVSFDPESNVTAIGPSAFSACKSLESFAFPEGVKTISTVMFSGCDALRELTIPEGVTTIGEAAFMQCTLLKNITIPASVTKIQTAAFAQSGLESVTFADGSDLGEIGDSVFASSSLKEITLPDGLDTIGKNVFSSCEALEKITIPASVYSIGNSFGGCTSLKEINYLGVKVIWESITKNIEIPEGAAVSCWDDNRYIENGIVYVLQEDGTAFAYTKDGTLPQEVTVPAYITVDGVKYPVSDLGPGVFNGSNVTKVTIESGTAIKEIREATFSGCSNLKEVVIPDGVTSIGQAAFISCMGLEKISIPSSVKSIGNAAFSACSALKELELNNGLETIGPAAFMNCSSLTSVTIPASVTDISNAAFSGAGLESVTFEEPSSLDRIGQGAFNKCTALEEIVLPDGLKTIDMGAFDTCSGLKKVSIPASVTTIGENAFRGCTTLTEIAYYGTQEQWDELVKNVDLPSNAAVYTDVEKIDGAKVLLVKTAFTYNGKVQKPAVKTVGGKALKEGTDYRVSFSASPKNAGTYTMTITGMKKYAGTTKTTFRISKAANTMTAKGKKPKVKYKKLKKKAQKIKRTKAIKVSNAQGTVTYKLVSAKKGSKKIKLKKAKKQFKITAKTGKIKVKKKLKKGTYKLKVKVTAAGNANYNAIAKTVTVKIKVK